MSSSAARAMAAISLPSLAKIGFDCGSSAEVCVGRGLATLPPSQVEVHPTVGQGMLILIRHIFGLP